MHALPTEWIPTSSQSCLSSANHSASESPAVSLQKFWSLPTALHLLTRPMTLVLLRQMQCHPHLGVVLFTSFHLLGTQLATFEDACLFWSPGSACLPMVLCLCLVLKERSWVNFMSHPICLYHNLSYHSSVSSTLLACNSFFILPYFLSFYEKRFW